MNSDETLLWQTEQRGTRNLIRSVLPCPYFEKTDASWGDGQGNCYKASQLCAGQPDFSTDCTPDHQRAFAHHRYRELGRFALEEPRDREYLASREATECWWIVHTLG